MVSRSNTSKTIRRRTGGAGKKTGAGTNMRDTRVGTAKDLAEGKAYRGTINRPDDWEMVPGTGTSPYNPPEWRKKKKPDTKVSKEDLPPPKGHEENQKMKRFLRRQGVDLEKEKELRKSIMSEPMAMSKAGGKVSKSKGGTVKKKYSHGGKIKTKKTYGGHHGSKLVASLYD